MATKKGSVDHDSNSLDITRIHSTPNPSKRKRLEKSFELPQTSLQADVNKAGEATRSKSLTTNNDVSVTAASIPTVATPGDSLAQLPTELKELVFSSLNLLDKLDLKLTCRYFYNYIPDYTPNDYHIAEQLPEARTCFYACCLCQRFRPRDKFADNSRVQSKAPGGKQAYKRWCLDCGLKENNNGHAKLPKNTWVRINKKPYIVCCYCGTLAEAHMGYGSNGCIDCWRLDKLPRLENHADPVPAAPAKVAKQHRIEETWVSRYANPYDVVQSAIRVGVTKADVLVKHKKWDLNGKELAIDGNSFAEDGDLTYKLPSKGLLGMVPRLTKSKSGRKPYRQKYKAKRARNETSPPLPRLMRSMVPAAQDAFLSSIAASSASHVAEIDSNAAKSGPSTQVYTAERALGPAASSEFAENDSAPLNACTRSPLERNLFTALRRQAVPNPHYPDGADLDMRPACLLKVKLPVRAFSTKSAPPSCEVPGNSGNIIAKNYLKARQALNITDSNARLGWYYVETLKGPGVTDLKIISARAPANMLPTILKRKAPEIDVLETQSDGSSPNSYDRGKRRLIHDDSEEEWEGISSSRSSSPEPDGGKDT